MRKLITAAMAMALAFGGAMAPSPSEAGQAKAAQVASYSAGLPVHYDSHHRRSHYRDDRGGRPHWGDHRRAHDQARIAEADRRAARRIERERAERRAWHVQRHQYSHYRGW
jgi:hypothetical protein